MNLLPRKLAPLADGLTDALRQRRRWRREVRLRQRACEPELAYGRHHGTPPDNAREAGVLLLLYPTTPRADDWAVALTRRSTALPDHPGQVCLPGGMLELGEGPQEAALREWEEEMGTSTDDFHLLGELNTTYVFVSNFRVVPIVGVAPESPAFRPNPAEVARVLELPASVLIQKALTAPHDWQQHRVVRSRLQFNAPHIDWDGERIWGATLGMLVELACYLDQIGREQRTDSE